MSESQQKPLSPEQIVSYNQAFADSLIAIEGSINHQRNQILAMIISGLNAMIMLGEKTITDDVTNRTQKVMSQLQEAIEKITPAGQISDNAKVSVDEVDESEWYNGMMRALFLAQQNAVSAQNQLDITAVAALSQLISAMLSIVTVADVLSLKE